MVSTIDAADPLYSMSIGFPSDVHLSLVQDHSKHMYV